MNNQDTVRIASFDIGKKNFSFCVEEIDVSSLRKIKNIPVANRYNPNGTCTDKMKEIMFKVYKSGKIILHKNLDLTTNCDSKLKLDPETYHNMVKALDVYLEFWDTCSVFVIEEQMAFGSKLNKMALKLGQHCYSYFVFKYAKGKTVLEFPSYHKTQVLGAEKALGKPYKSGKARYKAVDKGARKKWAVVKCREILGERGEDGILRELDKAKKKDDLADVVLQLQAFKYLVYVNKKL